MVQPSNSWGPPAQQTIPSITPQRHQGTATSSTQSQRVCFWAAAAFAWAVWALAVTAAAHDEWLALANQDTAGVLDAGNEPLLHFCDNGLDDEEGRFCNLYRGFTAMQFAATVTCSIAVALLGLAAFRPAVAGCASVKSLATAGGMLLITYAVLQLGSTVLAFFLEREVEDIVSEEGTSEDNYAEVGLTFWVSFAGLVLALLTSSCILVKARHAGDGPFYRAGRLWVASGLAWVVWALAVTATAHDEWLLYELEDVHIGDVKIRPGVEFCGILDELDYDDDQADEFDLLCDFHRGFTATQIAATAFCSLAVVLLALAAFRPAVAGCASVKSLSRAGGVLLIVYIAVQIGAGVLAYLLGKEWERVYNDIILRETNFEIEVGPMFWVVVCGVVLAVVASWSLLASAKNAENGPLYGSACCVIESGAPIRQKQEEKMVEAWESA